MKYNYLENVIVNKLYLNDENYKILKQEDIFNYDFNTICIEDYGTNVINDITYKDIYNDIDNPFVLENDPIFKNKNLYINTDFYINNQEYVDNLLCKYLINLKKEELTINSLGLIKPNIIESIVSNPYIKSVDLCRYGKDGYTLTKEVYLKFKKANKYVGSKYVSEDLKENFDDCILCNAKKTLVGRYTYSELVSGKAINLYENLNQDELDNLKYINDNSVIVFHISDYEHIMLVNKRLKEIGKNNSIRFEIDNKVTFNKFIFENNINDNNIFVKTPDMDEVNLVDYLKFEKILYQMINNTENLSPFEKYIYAYNITKQFKDYKENEKDKYSARKLYSLLVNEYMVCVGYSRLFGDLLEKMGISSFYLPVTVDESYDNVNSNTTNFTSVVKVNKGGHARRYIHIVDPKYNIDGYYVADPTWDNDLEHDYYNYLAMTDNEATYSSRYLWYDSLDVFNVNNISEYINKMKFIMGRKDYNYFKQEILNVIKKIDSSSYNLLLNKYKYIDLLYNKWPDNITDLIYDLGEIIVRKVNKQLDWNLVFKAVEQVYINSYGFTKEELYDKLEFVRNENLKRQNKEFPIRYKIDNNNIIEKIESDNKFETRKL